MMGALAGIALTFIGGELFFKTYGMPIVGSVTLGIILAGLVAKVAFPGRVARKSTVSARACRRARGRRFSSVGVGKAASVSRPRR
jgi:hypothetical protein